MAELAASVIGIVSAGTKVTLVLSQLAVDIGSAGREARMISNEIRSFCAVVKTLGETLEKVQSSSYYAHCTDMTKDMTAASLEMFTELLNATESIRGLTRSKEGKISVVGRVQWAIFRKPKIAYLRAAIEAYKSNLTLMLGTLNTAEKVTRQISVAITPEVSAEHEQDQLLLQSLELDQQSSLSDLEQAEREYQEADDPGLPSNDGTAESSSPTAIAATASEATATSRTTLETDSYVNSARDEIESIRASLSISLSAFDPSAVQQQVVQYSRRLSILVSADQKRISQRWSSIPDSLPSTDTETDSNLRGNPHDPSYNTLRDQLLVRQPYFRKAMLERLVREVYYHAIKLPYMDVEESNLRRLITEQVNPATSRQQRYWVDLSRTDLSNIPETIIDVLPKPLSNLNLAHNRLQEIPLSLTLCQKLTNINLSNNRLERFPEPVLHIHTLQILHLRDNQLTAIPATITNLQKLSWLGIQNNMITGLPFVLADLPELISLHHWGNPIGFPSVKLLDMYTEEQLRNDPKPLTDTNHIHTKVVKEYLAHYPEDVSEIVVKMILGVPIQEQLPGEWALAGSKGFTKSMFSGSWRPSPTLSRFGPGTNSFTSWQGEPFGDSAASMEAPSKTPGSAVETSAHRNNTVQVRVTPDAEESSVSIESSNPTISQSYVAKQMPESTSGSRPRQAKDLAPIANAFMSSKIAEGSYFALGVQTPNLSETASNSATTTQASQDQISRKLSLPANFHGRLRNAVESNRRYSAVFVDPRPAPQPRRVSANLEVANDPIYSAPPESDVSSQAQHESSDHANTRAKAKQLKAKKLPKKGWRFSGSDLDVPPILPTPRAKAKQLKAKNKSKKEWRFSDPDLNIPPSPTTFPPPAWL